MEEIILKGYTADLSEIELDYLAAFYAEHPELILQQVEDAKGDTQP